MERSGVKCFHCTHVFDLTNLKGEKRRNVGKLNNELNIVNQFVDLHFLLFVNITGNWKNWLALSFREQLTRFYHKESSSPHPAIVPIEGAVLFELGQYRNVPVPVAAYNLKSNVFCRKAFTEMNRLWNYTEELSVILAIKSLFLKYHHTALLIKKGGGQIEATISCIQGSCI